MLVDAAWQAALTVAEGGSWQDALIAAGESIVGSEVSGLVGEFGGTAKGIVSQAETAVAKGVVGGVEGVVEGHGFAGGFVGGTLGAIVPNAGSSFGSQFEAAIGSGLSNGLGSLAGGGSFGQGFEDGAVTSAAHSAFQDMKSLSHPAVTSKAHKKDQTHSMKSSNKPSGAGHSSTGETDSKAVPGADDQGQDAAGEVGEAVAKRFCSWARGPAEDFGFDVGELVEPFGGGFVGVGVMAALTSPEVCGKLGEVGAEVGYHELSEHFKRQD